MSDEEKLLPTPTMMDGTRAGVELDPEHWERKRAEKAAQGINLHFHLSVAMPKLAQEQGATSASSAELEDSTSPSKPSSDTSQQPSSSGTNLASESSPDIGPGSPSSETSESSDLALLPTPAVNDMGAGKTVEVWDEWTEKMKAAHGNGNGHGRSLAIEALRLISSAEASLAKTSAQPESARASRATGQASSTNSPVWSLRWDPDSYFWKTSEDSSPQLGLIPVSEERPWPRSRERWPTSGSLVSTGSCWELRTWVPPTGGTVSSSSLPTPTVQDGENTNGPSRFRRNTLPLNAAVQMLPTPNGDDANNVTRASGEYKSLTREVYQRAISTGEPTNPRSAGGSE